jgi:YD repeat-containing protein
VTTRSTPIEQTPPQRCRRVHVQRLHVRSRRRLVSASTLDSATPFTFGFTDVLPSSTVAPGAPAAGSWRTDTTADEFGRPLSLLRFLDATNKQTYTFTYATPFTPRPTQLAGGHNGSLTSITTFVYDDFGRLVETTAPEAGAPGAAAPTRYEYDVASRMIKKRVGVGTPGVRTSVYTYDSLGRTTFVDHDTEHPVSCAGAPDGTPIQDEEYRYDDCVGDAPSTFTCANALGKLTISRAILQCSSGQVIKRGRWYDYDAAGRVSRVGYATVTGSTIGTVAISTLAYTSASRVLSWTNPLTTAFGTKYTFDAASGRPTRVDTSAATPSPIVTNLLYRAFGPNTNFATPVVQPAGQYTRTLWRRMTYRTDDSASILEWQLRPSNRAIAGINIVGDLMTYGPAGLLSLRQDEADIQSSRHYGYDALLRMTCEARGSGTTQPSSSDCVTSSTRLAGLYTYGNGESATSPPDVRLTSFIKGAGTSGASYTSPSAETYTYLSGSGQSQQINRTGGNLVLGYDALGRRSFDEVSSVGSSRRDYTYLPNGQLGSVSGVDGNGQPYTTSVRYDAEGRPLTIQNTHLYELFWDDADRLIAVSRSAPGTTTILWHYHYLGSTLLAMTRVIPGAGGTTKRFWAASDERGLIYRLFDEQGATFWQARWDATGWRQIVGTPQPNMWVPFALPGQIILEGTEAFAGSTTTVRAPIALNQWRAYDPLLGAFLQSDSLDHRTRLTPEGYVYGCGSSAAAEN